MENALACILAIIDADIIAIRMETFVYLLLYILQHNIHSLTFYQCKDTK